LPEYVIQLDLNVTTDQRRYNLPTTQHELAAIIPNDTHTRSNSREIIIRPRGGGLMRVSECHPAYFSLHFSLLSPCGQLSWEPNMPCNPILPDEHDGIDTAQQTRKRKCKTMMFAKYVQFRSHPRPSHIESDHLFRARLLFQEWLVLTWAAIEHCRLTWIHDHQRQIHAELYSGLMDAVHEGMDAGSIGRRVVLPSSVTSSPRYMQKNLQNALALLRRFGGSDLFITFTANPHWPEIENALLPGQKASDQPNLIAHVFHLKFKSFLADKTENEIFDRTVGYVYTIEYQKRGLPHVHIILFLHPSARLQPNSKQGAPYVFLQG
jgi:Helitron helicase-like domain at N-terminus